MEKLGRSEKGRIEQKKENIDEKINESIEEKKIVL